MMKPTSIRIATALALGALAVTTAAWAQQAPKPENQIRWRQSAFQVIALNTARIKASVDGTYNKDEVVRSASAIAALANTNLLTLFTPGTEAGKGWHDTTAKAELFKDTQRVAELNAAFTKEANELLRVAQAGDAAAVKEQHGKLARSCKSCHDDFRNAN
jgi:cytochrome c556